MKKLLILVIIGAVFALTALPALAALDTGLDYGTYSGLGTKDSQRGNYERG